MEIALYENALQVVPLVLIALFLERRGTVIDDSSPAARRWARTNDRLFVIMGATAFMVSLLVVAGAVDPAGWTAAIVAAALGLSIGLLFSQIWIRFQTRKPNATE